MMMRTATRADRGAGSAVPPQRLRELAARGELVDLASNGPAELVSDLRAGAFAFAYPLVYEQHTRRLELTKRHARCATSVELLQADCHDGFQDDVYATVDYLLRYAKQPIQNLEGWIVSRLLTATVDGYRRRRGELGALQRPRIPKWLAIRLGDDPWLVELAVCVLEWVGVRVTAGLEIWPTTAWAELRAQRTGQWQAGPAQIERDIEVVLASMRSGNPIWFERHVEGPLGMKRPPVVGPEVVLEHGIPTSMADGSRIDAAEDRADALLTELAELAIDRLSDRLRAGQAPEIAVPEIITAVFLDAELDPDCQRLAVTLNDPQVVQRVVDTILEIILPRAGDRA